MIGRGIIKTDDHIRFGKFVDELSKIAYTVMYVSKTDQLIVCLHKSKVEELKSKFSDKIVEIKLPRGGLAFAKMRWR
ncbi:MAG: hypothetical protein ACXQTR_00045 [Candidatus Methanospirareceae archaeon]